ncbi:hypothetical protein KP509_23G012200 [Ceratopteris richardii]|uniref:BZIP domain-containing protein n=1 Tax=Ceratopteris richardii TaxID=49495 RepID=A0A8T2S033_CERRI|nr:hypothetical protein KP509_23G012200 [Ceratopteris richardii]
MDSGEVDLPDRHIMSDYSDATMESFLDELLKNTHSCTHTHTCNPPGPDNTHTHTCFHTHTQLLAPLDGTKNPDQSPNLTAEHAIREFEPTGKKQVSGNREAVRKYREKKKAQTAYLEEQVVQLRTMNQQLLRKLQGQAALEAEVVRLRSILAEFRGRIDGELGSAACPSAQNFRLDHGGVDLVKKDGVLQTLPGGYYLNSCSVACDEEIRCLHSPISSEKGPSTPQEYNSLTGGYAPSCELKNEVCRSRTKRVKRKD